MEIGVVGKPNVGKSTFFKAATMADVEIANFPFTTIKANVGVGYVRTRCACSDLGVKCDPQNSLCIGGYRFIPVQMIDVAGLVPGAHEGKGLGNQFLDDLRRADVLIHVIDVSGRTDEKGNPAEGHDPEYDIRFLEEEIDSWFYGILKKNWQKIHTKVSHSGKDLIKELTEQLSGLEVTEAEVKEGVREADLMEKTMWGDEDILSFATSLRRQSKIIFICGNKADLDEGNISRLEEKYDLIPTCADAELGLRRAEAAGLIEYLPGDPGFEVKGELSEKQKHGLEFIKAKVLDRFGSTGVQKCLNKAVFEVLGYVVVYPVENENRLVDSKENVLPDAYLMPPGSTALDLAYRIHSDIGDRFMGAIDCRTKKKIARDHVLQNGDIIKVVARK